jgi:hypothetical protein
MVFLPGFVLIRWVLALVALGLAGAPRLRIKS